MTGEACVADRYQQVTDAWSRVYAEFEQQKAAGQWNEMRTNALADEAHNAFDEAITIAPRSIAELQSYLVMLGARDIRESPDCVEIALITIGQALDLMAPSMRRAQQDAPKPASNLQNYHRQS